MTVSQPQPDQSATASPRGALWDDSRDRRQRDLVRLVGTLVGDVIAEQEGAQAFQNIEALRRGFITLRETTDARLRTRSYFRGHVDHELLLLRRQESLGACGPERSAGCER